MLIPLENMRSPAIGWTLLLGLVLIAGLRCDGQHASDSGVDPEMLKRVNAMANELSAPAKTNALGPELRLVEAGRAETPVGQVVRYEIFTKNLPTDRTYILNNLTIKPQAAAAPMLATLDSTGRVIGPDGPLNVGLAAAKGEPFRFRLTSRDGQYNALASVVPFPIRGSDRGCSLEAMLLFPDAEAVLLLASGFKPGSALHLDMDSENEKKSDSVNADNDGKYSAVLMPYKKEVQKGETTIIVDAPSCHMSLKFAWGKGTYKVE